ncbi:MAG: carboxypeptidase-like regulatory domain-containing protein [Cyclobacteriaceae bacterium]
MKVILVLLLSFIQFLVQAQSVQGTLIDKESRNPVAFAHISILDTNKGTVTNMDGAFVLKSISAKEMRLKVSSIGYETDTVDWSIDNNSTDLIIELNPAIIELDDVSVKSKRATPQEIIAEAYSRISQNYWLDEHMLTGYFTESEVTDGEPVYIAEAIIQAKIPGAGSDADGRIKIIHLADRKRDLVDPDKWGINYRTGGAYRCLKNSINDPINPVYPSHFENYTYLIEGYTIFNGKQVVIISFTDAKSKPIYGKLIIDLESYAFVRMEGTKTHGDGSPFDNWKWTAHTWIEQYMEDENGKWLLNSSIYIGDWIKKRSVFYWIGINKNRKFQTRSFYYTTDYAMGNEFTEDGVPFGRREEFYFRDFNNDETYWNSFNYMVPDATEKKILKKVGNEN